MTSTPASANTCRSQMPASSVSTGRFVQPPSTLGAGMSGTSRFTMRPSSRLACNQASAHGWPVKPQAWPTRDS
eukprot:13802173-Heterocapsa_arctica.AAC.1